ncbi:MAG: hypothetical protein OES09_01595 [Gammaproteobacteria bacterium]|nr:hypothetical protein [Gammaproteobacteria bacterium]
MPRHIVTFAKTSVAIEYPPGKISALIEFLYRHIESNSEVPVSDTIQIIHHAEPEPEWHIVRRDITIARASSVEELAAPLVEETLQRVAEPHRAGLAFHAAALSRRGLGILVPGQSGAGKSSLAAWLTAHGFNYLGDELTVVEPDRNMDAFTRPIKIKTSGVAALQTLIDIRAHQARLLRSGATIMIPHKLLNPQSTRESAFLSLIVFPHYRAQAELTLTPLSAAKTGLALMECLVNARNLAGHGFGAAATMVREVSAFRLDYGGFEQLEALLPWFRRPPPVPPQG